MGKINILGNPQGETWIWHDKKPLQQWMRSTWCGTATSPAATVSCLGRTRHAMMPEIWRIGGCQMGIKKRIQLLMSCSWLFCWFSIVYGDYRNLCVFHNLSGDLRMFYCVENSGFTSCFFWFKHCKPDCQFNIPVIATMWTIIPAKAGDVSKIVNDALQLMCLLICFAMCVLIT